MSGVEGSSIPQTQLRLQPPIHHAPQILRPIPNRNFLFSPTPRPAAFDPRLLFSSPAATEKDMTPSLIPPLKQAIRTSDHEVKNIGEATIQGIKEEETSTIILPPESGKGGKCPKKPKLSRLKRFVPQIPGSTDDNPSNALGPSSSCRYDSSLGLLTKKFINLLQQAEDGTLDLNRAADVLDVQKRRIYDITNVLEGVNLIEKKLKNRIHWRGVDMSKPRELDCQIAKLKADIETLSMEDRRLDRMIREMQENLSDLNEDDNNQKWLYLTNEDINRIPCFEDATLIAIKAPHGTSLEVPDPDEGVDFPLRRYQILLRSSMGPIDCYLISNHEEKSEATNRDQDATSFQPRDRDIGGMSERGEGQATHGISSDPISRRECAGGIVKIVPSDADMDADYWLLSDLGASVSATWNDLSGRGL